MIKNFHVKKKTVEIEREKPIMNELPFAFKLMLSAGNLIMGADKADLETIVKKGRDAVKFQMKFNHEKAVDGIQVGFSSVELNIGQHLVGDENAFSSAMLKSFQIRHYHLANQQSNWQSADLIGIFVHGGAFFSNETKFYDGFLSSILKETQSKQQTNRSISIVGFDYRLAPESPFPGPVNDCVSFVLWLLRENKNISPSTKFFFIGDSAGASLLGSTTYSILEMESKDIKHQFDERVLGQVLLWPVTDMRMSLGEDLDENFRNESFEKWSDPKVALVPKQSLNAMVKAFCPNEAFYEDGLVSIVRHPILDLNSQESKTFSNRYPSTLVCLSEWDALYSQGFAFASKLSKIGVDLQVWSCAAPHGFTVFSWFKPYRIACIEKITNFILNL